MCLEMARHLFFGCCPLQTLGQAQNVHIRTQRLQWVAPKCVWNITHLFGGKKDGSSQVQTSKKEANNTFVLPAIRRTLCLLLKVRDKVLKLKESKKKEYVRQSNRHKNRAFSCLL
jgi:hypothetical protein